MAISVSSKKSEKMGLEDCGLQIADCGIESGNSCFLLVKRVKMAMLEACSEVLTQLIENQFLTTIRNPHPADAGLVPNLSRLAGIRNW